ncbi:major facilitator superfamily transporter [Diaporthe helianthi]|uniref:Major facilitator superfamily transporter n=1 Tax=Diaporthe helianthi TaxID=158607 RepID=A0A2P5IE77_DIAHE|nr:major facilitator superfamily transporter [Diaporthe helianthi]
MESRDFATDKTPGYDGRGEEATQDHDQTDNSSTVDEKDSLEIAPAAGTRTPTLAAPRLSRSQSRRRTSKSIRCGSGSGSGASKNAAGANTNADSNDDDRSSLYTNNTDPLSPLENALSRPNHDADYQEHVSRVRTGATNKTAASAWSRPPDFEVTFSSDAPDPSNPRDWSAWYRGWVIFAVSYSTWAVVLYSTSYTATMPGLMAEFGGTDPTIATLGVTTYLLGLAFGSLVVAPMSELFGRRPVYLVCLSISALLVLPCALARSLGEIIAVRFFGAFFGAVMVCNGGGTIADISTEDNRARYMSWWSIAPLNGPVTGPLIGGYVAQYLGWRMDNWLVLALTGAAVLVMFTVSETYVPQILKQKAARRRKDEGDERYWCQYDSRKSTAELIKVNLSRPFVLSFTEPILWFFNFWISVIYGILYLCFVAYPIVFQQQRGWGPGQTGLSFIGIGIGTLIAIFLEPLWRKIINSHAKDPETGRVAPEASASIMCIGAVLTPLGQLVFSWTCLPTTIHYAIPIAFGIPFGCGNTLCFIYGSNYLAGAYGYFAASALAGNAVMRSIFGATLPLAGASMYEAMTPRYAGMFLGLLEVALIPIPWIFYRRGDRIRARSPVIRQMREEQAVLDQKRARGGGGGGAGRNRRQGLGQGEGAAAVVVVDSPGAVVAGGGGGGGDDVVAAGRRPLTETEPKVLGGETRAVGLVVDVEKGPGS